MNSPTTKQAIVEEFQKIAADLATPLELSDQYCSISKNRVTLRGLWSVDGVSGVFITLLRHGAPSVPFKHGYGLSYLVDFRRGSEADLEKAKSNDITTKVEVAKKYALGFLEGSLNDFDDFIAFATARVQKNIEGVPPLPTIKTNKTIRAEWI